MSGSIRIFRARKIRTMNRARPTATHVAVKGDRVLGVGTLEDLAGWGPYELDDRFADKVLLPGFVEGHCHAMEGRVWDFPYVGFHDRRDPAGRLWRGVNSIDAVVERLQQEEAKLEDPSATFFAWGFDPIYFGGRRMVAADLDRVSTTRPVMLIHASFHLLNVNSRLMEMAGIDSGTNIEGVVKGPDGKPTGELQELAARFMAHKVAGNPFQGNMSGASLDRFASAACVAGVTTATDLHSFLDEATVANYRQVAARDEFPLRLLPAFATLSAPAAEGIARVQALMRENQPKLRYGLVKMMTDGSIQGFTGRLKWPGYYNGHPNGVWNMPPDELFNMLQDYHDAGLHIHIHTNGDEASELMLDAIEAALRRKPRRDHRYTLQHCQMADESQFRRMAALGVCANLFANHLFYWGDQHYELTMGPDRASRMDATGTALRLGVPFAIHSDAPVTPLAPLFTAWCAANRQSATGRSMGEAERIPVAEALHAITLGAAYTLRMDGEIGSIETGKYADFAVLEDDPLAMPAAALKDIRVWGTVVGGRVFEAPKAD